MVEILMPFEEATDTVQISCIPSAGYILPCVRGLDHHIRGMISKYHSTFGQALKSSLRKRMAYYEQEAYIVAAILDPRFKLRWCLDESERKEFIETISTVLRRRCTDTTRCTIQDEVVDPPPKTLFSFMADSSTVEEGSAQPILRIVQLNNYLTSPCIDMEKNPAEFWKMESKEYPNLAELAMEVLGIKASSAAVERLFSIAGKVFHPERCNLRLSI